MRLSQFTMFGAIALVQGFRDPEPGQEGASGTTATATAPEGTQTQAATAPQNNAAAATDTQAIIDAVTQTVEASVAPIRDEVATLREQVQTATQPQGSPSSLYGGTPGQSATVRQGEDSLSSRGFEFRRIAQFCTDEDRGAAKLEAEYCQFLRGAMMQMGFRPVGRGGRSAVVPLSQDQIPFQIQSDMAEVR